MENNEKKDLFQYLRNEQEIFNIIENTKYYQIKVNLPNRPVFDEYIIKLNNYSEQEVFDCINDIIVSKHEDNINTSEWEKETGVEYEYNGSFTIINKETFDEKLEDGIEEINF